MSTLKGSQQTNMVHTHYKELQRKPNAQLTGSTFDAKHLDKFLHTEYGEKGPYPIPLSPLDAQGAGIKGESQQRMIPLQTNVRPDPCFLTVPRQMRKEVNNGTTSKPFGFVYQNIGLSSGSSPAKEFYQKERKELERLRNSFDPAKLTLNQESKGLMKPKDRLKEIEETKRNMQIYNEYKRAHALASKRDKLVKSGWKNGITGVDSVLDPETFFFKEKQREMAESEVQKMDLNEWNREEVKKYKMTNPTLELHNPNYVLPHQDEKIKIIPEWTSKPVGQERFSNTHKHLFEPLDNKVSKERALKLRVEETKGRKFDIITGASNDIKLT